MPGLAGHPDWGSAVETARRIDPAGIVVAAPGITPEQRKVLSDAVENMVKSDAWKDILKQKGWDDAYLAGDAFADFLKKENARVTDVLRSVGLVKS